MSDDEKEPAIQRSGGNTPGRRYSRYKSQAGITGVQRNKIRQEGQGRRQELRKVGRSQLKYVFKKSGFYSNHKGKSRRDLIKEVMQHGLSF